MLYELFKPVFRRMNSILIEYRIRLHYSHLGRFGGLKTERKEATRSTAAWMIEFLSISGVVLKWVRDSIIWVEYIALK